MSSLTKGDKVYCPSLSFKPYLVYTKKDINGIFIKHKGSEYWFTTNGVPSKTYQLPNNNYIGAKALWLGTEENKKLLSDLYDNEFKDTIDIPIYALNVTYNGESSDDWIFDSQEGGYDMNNPSINIESMRDHETVLSLFPQDLEEIQNTKIRGYCKTQIVCIAKDSINNWCNPFTGSVLKSRISDETLEVLRNNNGITYFKTDSGREGKLNTVLLHKYYVKD